MRREAWSTPQTGQDSAHFQSNADGCLVSVSCFCHLRIYRSLAPLHVAEVQQLLGDVVMATMRELEELREQGETELASIVGDDHARTARLRQDWFLPL